MITAVRVSFDLAELGIYSLLIAAAGVIVGVVGSTLVRWGKGS